MNTKGISLLIGIGQWVNPSAYCNKKAIGFHFCWLSVSLIFVDIECVIGEMGNKINELKKKNKKIIYELDDVYADLNSVSTELEQLTDKWNELKTKKAKKK